MKTSWDGIKFISQREAFVSVAYRDGGTDAEPFYAYGFGNQRRPDGSRVQLGDTITVEEAFRRQAEHIEANDKDLARNIKAPIRQCEWDAIASLYYQEGSDALRAVVPHFNDGDFREGIIEFASWDKDGLLASRRCKEIRLARHANYGDLAKGFKFYDGNPRDGRAPVYHPFPEAQP